MFHSIRTQEELTAFLSRKVQSYQEMLHDFDAKRAMDAEQPGPANAQYWLAWHATALLGAATEAKLAGDLLTQIGGAADSIDVVARMREIALDHALRSKPRVDSRSSLLASNLAEDHEHAFWVELAGALKHEED